MAVIFFERLTDEEREAFCDGFLMADDIGVNDWDSATPWGAPWYWATCMKSDSTDPEEWGLEWFEKCHLYILNISEEQERFLLDRMGSQATGADIAEFLNWAENEGVNLFELSPDEFQDALNKCFIR